jgi:hypothetical protein
MLSPARALAAVRRIPRRAETLDDISSDALEVAAGALEDLKRPRQALRIYRQIAQRDGLSAVRERCAARVAALAAAV